MKRPILMTGILFVLLTAGAKAQISPGELHRSHAFLEGVGNCNKCHSSDRQNLSRQCLECHTPIREQQRTGDGLHAGDEYVACEMCHVEHQGRDFDLIYFKGGEKAFDHTQTGYTLVGAHAALDCRKCHRPAFIRDADQLAGQNVTIERTFLGLEANCLSCHRNEHRGQLGEDCLGCHSQQAWTPAAGFDHDAARFALTGRHRVVDCAKCHPLLEDDLIADSPTFSKYTSIMHEACTDCHRDSHEGRLGPDCTKCHSTAGWRQVRADDFDHSRTRYPLEGKHADVACSGCHRPELQDRALVFERCMDCHSDYHRGQFASRPQQGACEECHTVDGFTPSTFTFAMHDDTDYPLEGAHGAIPCVQCHRVTRATEPHYTFQFASTACTECHDDPHRGQVDKFIATDGCDGCHSINRWDENRFDHNNTSFALDGRHASVPCRSCHTDGGEEAAVTFASAATARACNDCHTDIHDGQFAIETVGLSTDCTRCHTTADWRPTSFDHTRDSQFPLDGAHARIACSDCHKTRKPNAQGIDITWFKPLDTACVSCHANLESIRKAD